MHRIFVEGREAIFIEFLLSIIFGENNIEKIKVINTGGWGKLDKLKNEFEKSTNEGYRNLIIFDADTPQNGGGFGVRQKEIEDICQRLGIIQTLFLFPNNSLDGDYELLLENIINKSNKSLLDCFEGYENCISQEKEFDGSYKYKTPIRKAKIYSYVDAFPKSNSKEEKFKRGNWFFEDNNIWNIDDNDFIQPLLNFLKENLDHLLPLKNEN